MNELFEESKSSDENTSFSIAFYENEILLSL